MCTVCLMNRFPTGMRIPPSTAIRAPTTAPMVSPHFRSQQVMMASSSLDQHWPAARQVRAWGRPGNYYASSRDRRLQRRRFRTGLRRITHPETLVKTELSKRSAITHCWGAGSGARNARHSEAKAMSLSDESWALTQVKTQEWPWNI